MIYAFGDYELDTSCHELRHAGCTLPLEPQVWQLLAYLIAQRHRAVAKAELLDHLWSERFVSDNTLHQRISAVRRVLDDSRHTQSCIKTIRGNGYRFVAPVTEVESPRQRESPEWSFRAQAPSSQASLHTPDMLVARQTEIAILQQCWAKALSGYRQIVLVTGEPGIGKTTLVNAFTERLAASQGGRCVRGQCLPYYGAGETYLPILEALERLGRSPDSTRLLPILEQYAPSWLGQMPALLTPESRATWQHQFGEVTPARMLCELPHALEQFACEVPLVLVLEDLHWSDPSTLALLTTLAHRTEAARLLIIGTYRPTEARRHGSLLAALGHELRMHNQCADFVLTGLSQDAIVSYLAMRLPGLSSVDALAHLIYQRTEGHPLFMVTLVNAWIANGVLREAQGLWQLCMDGDAWQQEIPHSLQHMIMHQIEQLSTDQQELLAAASVAGETFSAAAVAACRNAELLTEEANCEALCRHTTFLHVCGKQLWPDGTAASAYGFAHTLYREVIYARLPVAQRIVWHRRLAERLDRGYVACPDEIAAQLAMHYEQGHVSLQAMLWYQRAARHALTRKGFQEAFSHLTQALALLKSLPKTLERTRHELDIHLVLGPVLMALKGYASAEVERTYARARQLCYQLPNPTGRLPVLWGLWLFHNVRAELQTAYILGEDVLRVAQQQHNTTDLLRAHRGVGTTLKFMGKFSAARGQLQQALKQYDSLQVDAEIAHYSFDHGSSAHSFMARTLWFLGYPDQGLAHNRIALAIAESLGHPHTLVNAQLFSAIFYQRCRHGEAMLQWAETALDLAQQQGIALRIAHGTLYRGYALTLHGQLDRGIQLMQQGLEAVRATGAALAWSWFLSMLAEAYHIIGRFEEGLRLVEQAFVHVNRTGECFWVAELHRQQGEFLLTYGVETQTQAASCFKQALAISQTQHAKSLELRAAMSLSRLWYQQGKGEAARTLLASIYDWFAEGFATADLLEARGLLKHFET